MRFQIFVLLLVGINSYAQQTNCEKFKEGVFIDASEELGTNVKITRTKDFQFEEYEDSKISIKLEVQWIDDCTYRLIFIEGNEVWNKKFGKGGNPNLIVNILEVGEDYYLQESHLENNKNKTYKNKMYKVD